MDKDDIQSYIAVLVGVICILGIIAFSDGICWGGDYKELGFHKKPPTLKEMTPSYELIEEAIVEARVREGDLSAKKTPYDAAVELLSKYTHAEFNITSDMCLQWKLNKMHAEYTLSKHNRFGLYSKAGLGKYRAWFEWSFEF